MEYFQPYLLKSNDVSINGINKLLQLQEEKINVSETAARLVFTSFYIHTSLISWKWGDLGAKLTIVTQ